MKDTFWKLFPGGNVINVQDRDRSAQNTYQVQKKDNFHYHCPGMSIKFVHSIGSKVYQGKMWDVLNLFTLKAFSCTVFHFAGLRRVIHLILHKNLNKIGSFIENQYSVK